MNKETVYREIQAKLGEKFSDLKWLTFGCEVDVHHSNMWGEFAPSSPRYIYKVSEGYKRVNKDKSEESVVVLEKGFYKEIKVIELTRKDEEEIKKNGTHNSVLYKIKILGQPVTLQSLLRSIEEKHGTEIYEDSCKSDVFRLFSYVDLSKSIQEQDLETLVAINEII